MAPDNSNNNVFLEIAKKLTPKLLALILILTLIALTLVITLTLYRGGSVNLKDMTFTVPDNQDQIISGLQDNLKKCNNEAKAISDQLNGHKEHPTNKDLQQCEDKISNSIPINRLTQYIGESSSADDAISKIQKLSTSEAEFLKLQQNYFFKLFVLEKRIPQYGTSISIHYDSENKRDIYILLQKILLELGFYNSDINGSQVATKDALISFQEAYNEKIENDMGTTEFSRDAAILHPLGHVGYRTLEAFRSWYRKNAV